MKISYYSTAAAVTADIAPASAATATDTATAATWLRDGWLDYKLEAFSRFQISNTGVNEHHFCVAPSRCSLYTLLQ